jgi:hypothetical protein
MLATTVIAAATTTPEIKAKVPEGIGYCRYYDNLLKIEKLYLNFAEKDPLQSNKHLLGTACNVLAHCENDVPGTGFRGFRERWGLKSTRKLVELGPFTTANLPKTVKNINKYLDAEGFSEKKFIESPFHFACHLIKHTFLRIVTIHSGDQLKQKDHLEVLNNICTHFAAFPVLDDPAFRKTLMDIISCLQEEIGKLERYNISNTLKNEMNALTKHAESILTCCRVVTTAMAFEANIPQNLFAGPAEEAAFSNSKVPYENFATDPGIDKDVKKMINSKEAYSLIQDGGFASNTNKFFQDAEIKHQKKVYALISGGTVAENGERRVSVDGAGDNQRLIEYVNSEFSQNIKDQYQLKCQQNKAKIVKSLTTVLPDVFSEAEKKVEAKNQELQENLSSTQSLARKNMLIETNQTNTQAQNILINFKLMLAEAFNGHHELINLQGDIAHCVEAINQFGNFSKPLALSRFINTINYAKSVFNKTKTTLLALRDSSRDIIAKNATLQKNSQWCDNVANANIEIDHIKSVIDQAIQCLQKIEIELTDDAIKRDMRAGGLAIGQLYIRGMIRGEDVNLLSLQAGANLVIHGVGQAISPSGKQKIPVSGQISNESSVPRLTYATDTAKTMTEWTETIEEAKADKGISSSDKGELILQLGEDCDKYDRTKDFSFKVFQFKLWWIPLWFTGIGLVIHLGLMLGAGLYRLANHKKIAADRAEHEKLQELKQTLLSLPGAETSTIHINSSLEQAKTSVPSKQSAATQQVSLNLDEFFNDDDEVQKPQSIQAQSTVRLIEDLSSQEEKDKKVQTNIGPDIVIKVKEAPAPEENEKLIVSQLINGLSEIAIESTLPDQLDIAFKEKMQSMWQECKEITKPHEKKQNYFFCQALLELKNKISSSSANLLTIEQAILSSLESFLMADLETNIKLAAVSAAATGRHIGGAMLDDAIKPLLKSYPSSSIEINAIIVKALNKFLDLVGSNRVVSTSNRLFDTQPDPTFKALADRKKISETRAELGKLIQTYTPEKPLENNNTPSRRRTSSAT